MFINDRYKKELNHFGQQFSLSTLNGKIGVTFQSEKTENITKMLYLYAL